MTVTAKPQPTAGKYVHLTEYGHMGNVASVRTNSSNMTAISSIPVTREHRVCRPVGTCVGPPGGRL